MISFPTGTTTSLGLIPNLIDILLNYFKTKWLSFLIKIFMNQLLLLIFYLIMKKFFYFDQQVLVANIENYLSVNYRSNWFEVGKLIIGKGEIVR